MKADLGSSEVSGPFRPHTPEGSIQRRVLCWGRSARPREEETPLWAPVRNPSAQRPSAASKEHEDEHEEQELPSVTCCRRPFHTLFSLWAPFFKLNKKSTLNHVLPAMEKTHTHHMSFQRNGSLFKFLRKNSKMGIFYGSPDPLCKNVHLFLIVHRKTNSLRS